MVGPIWAAALAGAGAESLGRVRAWRCRGDTPMAIGVMPCPAPGCPSTCPEVQQASAPAEVARRGHGIASWLPGQHGAWSLLGCGLALACIAAGGPGAAAIAAVVASIAGFVACHAATARGSRRRAATLPAGAIALGALLMAAAAGAPATAAVPLALAGVLGLIANYGLHRLGPRARWPLMVSTVGLGAATTAVALAGGALLGPAVLAGGLIALHGIARLFGVRALIAGPAGRSRAWIAAAVPCAAVAAVVALTHASPWLALAFTPGLLITARLAHGPAPAPVRVIGRHELAGVVAFLFLAGVGIALG